MSLELKMDEFVKFVHKFELYGNKIELCDANNITFRKIFCENINCQLITKSYNISEHSCKNKVMEW
jgi:hypothetical protein